MFKKLFRKAFLVDLDDALTYPTSKTICQAIQEQENDVVFLSEEKPIVFQLQETVYAVSIKSANGGYIIHCKEK
ncbi:DUF4318 domain-containing protein [Paraliobacillus sp. JSM ZJ581]|uniref:DUF4318 domain-containing protein n=1 Tax=Paraliobacillus sp. JSM ZJ581 TaxID=3342118 RepID=UPI0035A94A8E